MPTPASSTFDPAAETPQRPCRLIVGPGYVGTALMAALHLDSELIALRRSATATPFATQVIQADVSQAFRLPALPPLDAVIYLVGADARTPEAYHAAYVAGPARLIEALMRAGQRPRQLIYAASTAVYGQHDGETVDEAAPTEPGSFSGRAVLEGEQIMAASPWPTTRVRLAGIYGPGRDRFLRQVLDGEIGLTEADPHTNRIHRDDCVAIIQMLLTEAQAPEIVLACDPAPTRRNTVIRWIASEAGIEATRAAGASPRRVVGDRRCHPAWLLGRGYDWRHRDFRSGYAAPLAALLATRRGP